MWEHVTASILKGFGQVKRWSRIDLWRWILTKRRRREVVLRHLGRSSLTGTSTTIVAPEILSFSRNGAQTIRFFDDFRSHTLEKRKEKRRGRWAWPSLYVDLSKIRDISVPAAVVLSAEFQRWKLFRNVTLKPKGVSRWHPRVRRLLCELGTFDLLGLPTPTVRAEDEIANLFLLPLASGEKHDGRSVDDLQAALVRVGRLFDKKPYLFEGISEAVLNCIDHAYAEIEIAAPRFPTAGHRWWATSCYDPVSDSLRFFVFDQGHGIPATIQAKPDWRTKIENALAKVGWGNTDANIIEMAFEIGRTRTGLAERGKGLHRMQEVILKAGQGYLRVLSGAGDVKIRADGGHEKSSHRSHVGGTLVEWNIPSAVFNSEQIENA